MIIEDGPTVVLAASGTPMRSTLQGLLPLSPMLTNNAQMSFALDDLQTGTLLLLLAQLCDNNCIAIFTKFNVQVLKSNQVIITGRTCMPNGLWSIPITPPIHQANRILWLLDKKPKEILAV
jgi:hypothetical protein